MKRRITITCQDDTTFFSFVSANKCLCELVVSAEKTGQCLCENGQFSFIVKKTKAGTSINGYHKEELK